MVSFTNGFVPNFKEFIKDKYPKGEMRRVSVQIWKTENINLNSWIVLFGIVFLKNDFFCSKSWKTYNIIMKEI